MGHRAGADVSETWEKEVLQVGAAFPGRRLDGKGAHHRRDRGGAVLTHGGSFRGDEGNGIRFLELRRNPNCYGF